MKRVDGRSVTVVVTCYSGELYFDEAIWSIENQTARDVQIVIHDNGCGPSYRQKIRAAAMRSGAHVVRSEVNRYGEGLRIDVLPFLKSRYVAILHDDDYYEPTKIADGLEAIRRGRLDYIFTERRHVHADGTPFSENYEEVNTRPFEKNDFPFQHIADTYYRGLRLHFSTIIAKTRVAKDTLFGDPFLPRITDSLFTQRLLMNPRYRGAAVKGKLTNVRVHGANDMLYSKFGPIDRAREFGLLQFSEYSLFREILDSSGDQQLAQILRIFPGIPISRADDRIDMLVRTALEFRGWGNAKPLMGTYCIHSAWNIDPIRTMRRVRELSMEMPGAPVDTNQLAKFLYRRYMDEVSALLTPPQVVAATEPLLQESAEWQRRSAESARKCLELEDAAVELVSRAEAVEAALAAVRSSTSWKLTAPLRQLAMAFRSVGTS